MGIALPTFQSGLTFFKNKVQSTETYPTVHMFKLCIVFLLLFLVNHIATCLNNGVNSRDYQDAQAESLNRNVDQMMKLRVMMETKNLESVTSTALNILSSRT